MLAYIPTLYYILNPYQIPLYNSLYTISIDTPAARHRKFGLHSTDIESQDSNGIPLWEDKPEDMQKQIRQYGPDPPEEIFKKPTRPLGFWGKGMGNTYIYRAPDMAFVGVDRGAVVRNSKKKYLYTIYRNVRMAYKKYIKEATSMDEILYWKYKLASLPKDSCPTRHRRRCILTGRGRGVVGLFGLSRHKTKELIVRGWVPGVARSSW